MLEYLSNKLNYMPCIYCGDDNYIIQSALSEHGGHYCVMN